MNILNIKENHLLVSRAATAIFLIFQELEAKGWKVLLPANICYAAIYPVIYSGNEPVFCDVDGLTGNVTYEIIKNFDAPVDAMIIPHMYGNPVVDIEKIAEYCRQENILLIEDCASAMGAAINGKPCGVFGEYSIFSTGYSKTIDVGGGGLVLSNHKLERLENEYKKLPNYSLESQNNEAFFSKMYRIIRNNPEQTLSEEIYKCIPDKLQNVFIHYTKQYDGLIMNSISQLDEIVNKRRRATRLYEEKIIENMFCKKYVYEKYSVPWRYNLLIDAKYHKSIIEYLLKNEVPVSDWYPISTDIFGDKREYSGAKHMEERIINFPLLLKQDEIVRICKMVNDFWKTIKVEK